MSEIISEEVLRTKVSKLEAKELVILKFTAQWCGPCKKIKDICSRFEEIKPKSIQYYEIDIDESLELYMKMKKMKMLNGIPALLAYCNSTKEHWYIPDFCHLGSDQVGVELFFKECLKYVS
jgi:thiol-disulfide isomerase/thioredoxin